MIKVKNLLCVGIVFFCLFLDILNGFDEREERTVFTISKNTQIILFLLKQHDIRQIVLNPGATNMPVVQGVQNDPFFTCYSIVDERSAVYFAIGLYLETGRPVALSCTSAQAARNYIPGLTEAFYKHVPILAITASKPVKCWGQEYMQSSVQTSLPVDAVKQTYALPYVSNKDDELQCVRMVNEAILEISHRTPGPVQLNMPIKDGEWGVFNVPKLPSVRVIKRYMVWEKWNDVKPAGKIMLVIGERRYFSDEQIAAIELFIESHNAFIYVNHLSNYHGKYSVAANLALSCVKKIEKPDILITIGGQTGDYPLFGKLTSDSHFEHWRIAEDGEIVDTYDKLTKVFECPLETFFVRFGENILVKHTFYESWKELQAAVSIPKDLPFSNAYLAQQLHNFIPKKSYLNLAILNSLRVWSFFPLDPSILCYSNVGAFGIDGCMSVLLGQSVITERMCFLVIGDLAFFYDMNSLGIRHVRNNVRILLVNNGCGAEFKLFNSPGHKIGPDAYIAAAGHYGEAKGWAQTTKFKYLSAFNKEEILQHREEFVGNSDRSIVFEVFVKAEDESNALELIIKKNMKEKKRRREKKKLIK